MEKIAKILTNFPLLGKSAHAEMMPEGRRLDMDFNDQIPIQSAVLLLLYKEGLSTRIVFIERSDYDGVHGGQIAFPGGRFELFDADFADTAIRETREEIGLTLPIKIIGHLSDLYVPPSRYLIHPFVGVVDSKPAFIPDNHEVKSVFTEDIAWLAKPESRNTHFFQINHERRAARCFVSGKHLIWGATAMILNEFLVILHNNDYFTDI